MRLFAQCARRTRWAVAASFASLACNGALVPPVPASTPTHHAVVEGWVVDPAGDGMASVGVGIRFAASSPRDRQVNASGGGMTDATGFFQFVVQASKPPSADGEADVFVAASKPAPPGGVVAQDSVLVRLNFVPFEQQPATKLAGYITLGSE